MWQIVRHQELAEGVCLFEVEAPRVAQRHRAGQFVMVRPRADSERIPLTVADASRERGTVTLVVQQAGRTTSDMCHNFRQGDAFANLAGPLGNPTHIALPGQEAGVLGTVVGVAGGIGAAPILPIMRAFRAAGHEVITILGARRADLMILRPELEAASHRVLLCTDDGSLGRKGFVTHVLKDLIEETRAAGRDIHLVIAIGPPLMMKFTSQTTLPYGVQTLVSLNTVMVDGTGMCGGCRVLVDGQPRYVCVDGPEFDGHKVDFDGMMRRQATYRKEEQESLDRYRLDHACRAAAAAERLPS